MLTHTIAERSVNPIGCRLLSRARSRLYLIIMVGQISRYILFDQLYLALGPSTLPDLLGRTVLRRVSEHDTIISSAKRLWATGFSTSDGLRYLPSPKGPMRLQGPGALLSVSKGWYSVQVRLFAQIHHLRSAGHLLTLALERPASNSVGTLEDDRGMRAQCLPLASRTILQATPEIVPARDRGPT